METDWPVWPIFIVQLFTFLMVIFGSYYRAYAKHLSRLTVILLLIIAAVIALSLYHDSTDPLSLYF